MTSFIKRNETLWLFPSIPKGTKFVDVSGNTFDKVGKIPVGVEVLNVSYNPALEYCGSLPEGLRELDISGTSIARLPKLPSTLRALHARGCRELVMPDTLPEGLEHLDCSLVVSIPKSFPSSLTYLRIAMMGFGGGLPDLPKGLTHLDIRESNFHELPELPYKLKYISTDYSALENKYRFLRPSWVKGESCSAPNYINRIRNEIDDLTSHGRTLARTSQIKEELIANVFHPKNVEKWLEMGEDVLDMMMGA